MSHEERQLLDEALIRTYNSKGITHDNASLEDPANPGCYREMPVLGDLYEILKAAPETTRMAHILNRLVNAPPVPLTSRPMCGWIISTPYWIFPRLLVIC